ncbi:hypothetical protein [Nitrososphaera sp. AFS]|uniref:hypothetical protein n=1 Tax=Nitrososphaera sp. AFS TaxID=2301191 RepID=UPI00139237F9|nr:hypothetical protein [Nitrososphaera sp. AFS]NAL78920.1 hypothetical protein [Nitrososphaera sp. AFS]
MIKNSQVTIIVSIVATLAASAVVMTPGTQSTFAASANGVNGGTPCARSGDVGQHNPVTMPIITIFVCDDHH